MSKNFISGMSKFEKIFWATILILALIYAALNILASSKRAAVAVVKKPIFEEVLDGEFIKKNIEAAKSGISDSLDLELNNFYGEIDKNIDNAFASIENNVDKFLDFHYSVIGEYAELTSMANDKIKETIRKRLIGTEFESNIKEAYESIDAKYKESISNHISAIDAYALRDVDTVLNRDIIKTIESDINDFKLLQEEKLGLVMGVYFLPKIVQAIGAKIALKASGKMVIKSTVKMGAKYATAGSAAFAGTACGPFVWVCSPVLAVSAWFTTDAIVLTGDEYYNRGEFKDEILGVINEQKESLKNSTKYEYKTSFERLSNEIQERYKNNTIKKVKLKEHIFN